jgi:uncharacterized Zn-binding protein involved in type VI secretion
MGMCAHAGQGSAIPSSPRVLASGTPVLTIADQCFIAGCPFTTPGGPLPCVKVQWMVGAARVMAGGIPVLTMPVSAMTIPNAVPYTVTTTQTRVIAQ